MNIKTFVKILFGSLALTMLWGCEIEQTQEGKLPDVDVDVKKGNLPKYEVIKTEEGKMPDVDVDVQAGQIPKYDVDAPDIVVGTKEIEVEVPDVDVDVKMKKETIDVPVVGIDMPDDNDSKE